MPNSPELMNGVCPNCSMELQGSGSRRYCKKCGVAAPFLDGIRTVEKNEQPVEKPQRVSRARHFASDPQEWLEAARATDQVERNFAQSLSLVIEMGEKLGLPLEVVEEAGRLTKLAFAKNLSKGRPIEVLVASQTYAAARRHGFPLTIDETATTLHVSKRDVSRTFRKCAKTICEELPPPTAMAYLAKTLGAMRFSDNDAVSLRARGMLDLLSRTGFIQGHSPVAIAAALVYLASEAQSVRVTQREIARYSFVTETTIRCVAKEIRSIADAPNLTRRS